MGDNQSLAHSLALSGLGSIAAVLLGIGLAFWALQQIRFDLFLRNPKSPQAKLLHILLSIALGYEAARFLLDYFGWAAVLKGLFA